MLRFFALAGLLACPLAAANAPADIARAIRELSLDRTEAYRVRDLTIIHHEIRVYLTDGYLIFSQPVAGRRVAAVFTTDVEGGDAEVLLMPPSKSERRALASYTGAPNLNEHFKTAVFLGAGDLYAGLQAQMRDNPTNRKVAEMGPVLDEQWGSVLRNLAVSYETRLTLDLLTTPADAQTLFVGIFSGGKLGNFDAVFDPRMPEQVSLGQVTGRNNRVYFDIWTSFEARTKGARTPVTGNEISLSAYRIETRIEPDLSLSAVTRVKVKPLRDALPVVAFDLTRDMRVEAVKVDGQEAGVLQRESLRANLGRGGNDLFLVFPPAPLERGREYEFEFRHAGKVIHETSDHIFYVSSRGNWYPTHGLQFTTFDLFFRYPQDLHVVSAGEVVEDKTEGDVRLTRRRTSTPIRIAGFNLGRYIQTRVTKGPYTVTVFANQTVERALQPKPESIIPPQLPGGRTRRAEAARMSIPDPGPSPTAHLQTLAGEIASALEFMASKFGPPALPSLTVSPIPGTFGQGFPGLIYLSTLSYLGPNSQARTNLTPQMELFFRDILQAHETAHQWWGNQISGAGYHDYWLMEALANYSAMLYLEKRRGGKTLEQALELYRTDLLARTESGPPVDAAGPIVLGTRLESSLEPRAWRAITYGKGSWIFHMLRGLMGDERFFAMLSELARRYQWKEIGTEEFRLFAAGYLPPKSGDPKLEAFFDQWIYSTGIPALKMSHSVKGKAPALKVTGTITQADVPEDFSMMVPVEVQFAGRKSETHWVRTSSDPVEFTFPVRALPTKVTLDPHMAVLRK
jgi:hypothetical protein